MLQGNNSSSLGIYPTSFTGDITKEVYRLISSSWDQKIVLSLKAVGEKSHLAIHCKSERVNLHPNNILICLQMQIF